MSYNLIRALCKKFFHPKVKRYPDIFSSVDFIVLSFMLLDYLDQELANIFLKGQTVNILDFMGQWCLPQLFISATVAQKQT